MRERLVIESHPLATAIGVLMDKSIREITAQTYGVIQPRPTRYHLRRFFRHGCLGGIILYGVVISAFLLLWLVVGESRRVISLGVSYLTLLLMPSLVLLPAVLLLRKWRLAILLIAPFMTFVITYGVQFLPRSRALPPDSVPVSFLTYNLHAERKILAPMIELIRAVAADIVALQEMSNEAVPLLDSRLADLYPYRLFYPEPNRNPYHGRALLSRYPVTENHFWPAEYPIPVRLQRALVDIQGVPVTIYNFHAPPSFPIFGKGYDLQPRQKQIEDILGMIAQDTGAVILIGDLNTYDLDQNYRTINAVLHDTYREAGWGMGFTNPDWSTEQGREGPALIPPHQRPDYIFHNDFFLALEARVWPDSGGSDHRPVWALLALLPDR